MSPVTRASSDPTIAQLAGVEYRWLMRLVDGSRRALDSNIVDRLYWYLKELEVEVDPHGRIAKRLAAEVGTVPKKQGRKPKVAAC